MGNRERGEVTIEAAGETHTMRFGINALCEVESHFGKPIMDVMRDLEGEPDLTSLRALFWIGLGGDGSALSIFDAGDVIDAMGIQTAGEKLGDAVMAAFPNAEAGDDAGKPNAGAAGTG